MSKKILYRKTPIKYYKQLDMILFYGRVRGCCFKDWLRGDFHLFTLTGSNDGSLCGLCRKQFDLLFPLKETIQINVYYFV